VESRIADRDGEVTRKLRQVRAASLKHPREAGTVGRVELCGRDVVIDETLRPRVRAGESGQLRTDGVMIEQTVCGRGLRLVEQLRFRCQTRLAAFDENLRLVTEAS